MDEKEFQEGRRQLMQASLDMETKALNYLLVANGAGFAGCLAALKEYASVPQMHGIGFFIAEFGIGLISAALAFAIFQAANFEMMKLVIIGDEGPKRAKISMTLANIFIQVSAGCFAIAIISAIVRFAAM